MIKNELKKLCDLAKIADFVYIIMKIFEHKNNWGISLDCQLKYLFFRTLHCRSQCLRLCFFVIFISWYGNIITQSVCICSGVYSAHCIKDSIVAIPGSKVHGASMGPIWGRQAPGGPHVGPMNFAIWGFHVQTVVHSLVILLLYHTYASVRPVLCLLLIKLVKLIKMALNIISVDSAL